MEDEEKDWKEKLCESTEEKINNILKEGITSSNLMNLSQLVDLQKDLSNIKYWEEKEMMYGRRYRGDYDGDYGRRGVPGTGRGRYRGEDMLEDMRENYGAYMDGARRYNGESDKAFDYMLKSAKEFFMHLFEESKNPEQEEKIRRTAQEISEM